jgi:hypothetical protein
LRQQQQQYEQRSRRWHEQQLGLGHFDLERLERNCEHIAMRPQAGGGGNRNADRARRD